MSCRFAEVVVLSDGGGPVVECRRFPPLLLSGSSVLAEVDFLDGLDGDEFVGEPFDPFDPFGEDSFIPFDSFGRAFPVVGEGDWCAEYRRSGGSRSGQLWRRCVGFGRSWLDKVRAWF
jgi:hypothetical protein